MLTLPAVYAGEDTVIIEPDPTEGEPTDPPEDPEEDPEEEPEEPQILPAEIDITPRTINRHRNGRYVDVHIELPQDFDAADIEVSSVRISEINSQEIDPIYALDYGYKVGDFDRDGVTDLRVRFLMNQIREHISHGQLNMGIKGALTTGEEFYGNDSVRGIDLFHWWQRWRWWRSWYNNHQQNQQQDLNERKFCFRIGRHLSRKARILKAVLWINRSNKKFYSSSIWCRRGGGWMKHTYNTIKSYYYLPVSGQEIGSEWDVTQDVLNEWLEGNADVTITLEHDGDDPSTYPRLVITYEEEGSEEEESAEDQDLIVVSPKIGITEDKDTIIIYYDKALLGEKIKPKNLQIYGWNENVSRWMPVSSCLNKDACSLSTRERGYSKYQIFAPVIKETPADEEKEEEKSEKKGASRLGQNYPNPFNPATTINYSVEEDCHVTIKLYNVCGQVVATIVDEYREAGDHSVYFDAGESLSRGIYYYQIKAGKFVDTKRMVILK